MSTEAGYWIQDDEGTWSFTAQPTTFGEELIDSVLEDNAKETLLDSRETTHGKFEDNSFIFDEALFFLVHSPNWRAKLSAEQRTALMYILGKISRIVSGDPNFPDHWEDIKGYVELVLKGMSNA